jgi:hypothetical protein
VQLVILIQDKDEEAILIIIKPESLFEKGIIMRNQYQFHKFTLYFFRINLTL